MTPTQQQATPAEFDYSRVPETMKRLPRWIGFTEKKVPVDPRTGLRLNHTDTTRHLNFETAHAGYLAGHCFALGFCIVEGDGICCVDLDKVCGNPEREQRAAMILQKMPGWIERSMSGTGLHIWGYGAGRSFKTADGLEFYTNKRAMLITGKVMPQSAVPDLVDLHAGCQWLATTFNPKAAPATQQPTAPQFPQLGPPPPHLYLVGARELNTEAAGRLNAGQDDDPERIRSALAVLRADDYDTWWQTGLALYRSTLEPQQAYSTWLEWSATCADKFSEQACQDKWASFATSGQPASAITLGTIFHRARQAGWTDTDNPVKPWRTPDTLLTEPQPAPYPTASLPTVMREAVKAIAQHVAAPEALAAQCVIAAAAYLAQTRINAPHIHYPDGMPCSLYQMALADSGDRKSACYRLAFKPLMEAEREERDRHAAITAEHSLRASLLKGKALQDFENNNRLPANPRTMYTDSTFEKIAKDFVAGMPAASWVTDEGGRVLGGHSMQAETRAATLGGLVKLYDDGTVERDRAGESSGIAYDRRFTMHLMAQAVTVREALNDSLLQGQGFLPRFLLTSAPSLAGTRFITAETLQNSAYRNPAIQRYWQRMKEIAATTRHVAEMGAVRPPVVALAAEALKVWLDFYNRVEAEQSRGGDYAGAIKPFASRAGENARRVAAVFALFNGEQEITGPTMTAACEVVEHSLGEWARWLGGSGTETRDNRDALDLLAWLKSKGISSLHRDKLGTSGPVRGRAKQRDKLLGILLESGWMRSADSRNFEVNPQPLADCAESAERPITPGVSNADCEQITAEEG
ncbi:hypothetical protein CDR19_11295 [Ectopseudomonas toyotomiensis]|uniref:Primase C terminal 2 (PriCT-2) n=1 Tax=Ectopseudomonas toyotomiensis TaxID=554344 RepID=A0A1I5W036_9GAMM|nr:DUF3987 domain-containing protein [Pseudomonas toyotomiensis]PIA72814.1 hypothetical protein CDR19_11295 [Pseudomonas toyotomiensis]SFQ13148.1 Primase C terminal 2 (PriCT-2) [Pseudomonas toyotomiensis]